MLKRRKKEGKEKEEKFMKTKNYSRRKLLNIYTEFTTENGENAISVQDTAKKCLVSNKLKKKILNFRTY